MIFKTQRCLNSSSTSEALKKKNSSFLMTYSWINCYLSEDVGCRNFLFQTGFNCFFHCRISGLDFRNTPTQALQQNLFYGILISSWLNKSSPDRLLKKTVIGLQMFLIKYDYKKGCVNNDTRQFIIFNKIEINSFSWNQWFYRRIQSCAMAYKLHLIQCHRWWFRRCIESLL